MSGTLRPPKEEPDPEPEEHFPRVVILPPNQPAQDREAFLRDLYRQHGEFILDTIARGAVKPESAKDLRQRVLLIVCDPLEHGSSVENMRGFLTGVIRNEVRNHLRRVSPAIDHGAEVEAKATSSVGPEGKVAMAQRWEKVMRYLDHLTEAEAEVIRCIDLKEMTIVETAAALGRARSTVASQHARAREKLAELARASERAEEVGRRAGR